MKKQTLPTLVMCALISGAEKNPMFDEDYEIWESAVTSTLESWVK